MTTILDTPAQLVTDDAPRKCPNPRCVAGMVREKAYSYVLFHDEPLRFRHRLVDDPRCDGTGLALPRQVRLIGDRCDHHMDGVAHPGISCVWCDGTNVVLWPAGMPPTSAGGVGGQSCPAPLAHHDGSDQ